MTSNLDLTKLFFSDLKKYNSTNFKTIERLELVEDNPTIYKAFSSVVTRFFIFKERHPEISETDAKILFFKLKIDMIARYFSEYPVASIEELRPFQSELLHYVKESHGGDSDELTEVATAL